MKFAAEYAAYVARRQAYNFSVIPYEEWERWFESVVLPDIRAHKDAGHYIGELYEATLQRLTLEELL